VLRIFTPGILISLDQISVVQKRATTHSLWNGGTMMIGTESTAISDTVITTPLLATVTTSAESESATGDDGNGSTTHTRRLADGGEATVEQVRAVLTTRPYVRFILRTRCIPPTLPLLLEQNGVTAEQWDDFWSPLKDLVQRGEQLEKRSWIIYAVGAVFVWTFLWMLLPLPLLLMYVYRRRKQVLVDDIVAYCKEGQQAEAIQANGYTLECEILPSEVNGSRLHLFILPVNKPYARFEVYNGRFTCPGWNDTCVNAQSFTSTMQPPVLFESVPLEDWSSFWAQLRKLYEPQTRLHDLAMKVCIAEILTLVMAILATTFTDAAAILIVLVPGALVTGMVYLAYRYYVFLGAKTTLVCDTAVRWAPRGVYMEHRRLMYLHPWLGLLERHYVYIFRLANDNTDFVEDPDDSRSSASGVRSRQSTGISGSKLSDDPETSHSLPL
jgi:hypothetical protein